MKFGAYLPKILYGFIVMILMPSPIYTNNQESTQIPQYKIPIVSNDSLQNEEFLRNTLNLNIERENLFRRGEVVFFSSFSYLWVYQLIFLNILFAEQFQNGSKTGELSMTNLIYSVLTSALMALMVTHKDNNFIEVKTYNEPIHYFTTEQPAYRSKVHEWRFLIPFMNYDF